MFEEEDLPSGKDEVELFLESCSPSQKVGEALCAYVFRKKKLEEIKKIINQECADHAFRISVYKNILRAYADNNIPQKLVMSSHTKAQDLPLLDPAAISDLEIRLDNMLFRRIVQVTALTRGACLCYYGEADKKEIV